MSKRGLGKGLGALIPEVGPVDHEQIAQIEVARIQPNPRQPRKQFDEDKLAELAASVREHGVVQPVLVQQQGHNYVLVAGERRWRAARMAGLERIPALVRDLTPGQVVEIALIENLQREDLNPLEEAEAYRQLLSEHGVSQEDLARRLGRSRPQISNTLRLLQLPPPVMAHVASRRLSVGHAKVLLGLEGVDQQVTLAERVLAEDLSVRQAEAAVERLRAQEQGSGARRSSRREASRSPEVVALENRLRELLGTPVKVIPGEPRGRIEIFFYGDEDLTRVTDVLVGSSPSQPGPRSPKAPFTV